MMFFSSIFTPKGDPEAFICLVIKGSPFAKDLWRMASSLSALLERNGNTACGAYESLRLVQDAGPK